MAYQFIWSQFPLYIQDHADDCRKTTTIGEKTYNVLLDAGPEGLSIERNARAMKVDLPALDALVLSHWHRDRT